MVAPWVRTLSGMQLAWSPGTNGKTITAETIILPEVADAAAFEKWLPSVKGKFVLVSMVQLTGRPDYNWEEYGTKESVEKMKEDRKKHEDAWDARMEKTGYNSRTLPEALEKAGAVGIVQSYWSRGFGANKIFSARTKKIPTVDVSLEDYGLVYRLTESGKKPKLAIRAD